MEFFFFFFLIKLPSEHYSFFFYIRFIRAKIEAILYIMKLAGRARAKIAELMQYYLQNCRIILIAELCITDIFQQLVISITTY
jgi:hypothetical protein